MTDPPSSDWLESHIDPTLNLETSRRYVTGFAASGFCSTVRYCCWQLLLCRRSWFDQWCDVTGMHKRCCLKGNKGDSCDHWTTWTYHTLEFGRMAHLNHLRRKKGCLAMSIHQNKNATNQMSSCGNAIRRWRFFLKLVKCMSAWTESFKAWLVLCVCPLKWLEVPSPSLHMVQFERKCCCFVSARRIAKDAWGYPVSSSIYS